MPVQMQCLELKTAIAPDWPPEVGMILSALEAGSWSDERRELARSAYHVKAMLRMFADAPRGPERLLYTRDVNHRCIGFVTQNRLPLGYGGILRVPSPQAPHKMLSIQCTLVRCRQVSMGWYEGALHFHRDRTEFLV